MAAAAAAMRAAYRRLGFTNQAAAAITDDQDIDSVDELEMLTEEEIESLCKALRRPGGTIANPDAGNAGAPAEIPNPGINVSLRAETNLKLAGWFLKHRTRVSRPKTSVSITLQNVRALKEYKSTESSWESPAETPTINYSDWPKTMEAIMEYLRACPGTTKIPLAYVVRDSQEVVDNNEDPPENYETVQDEIIARASHVDQNGDPLPTYQADNRLVWEKISAFTRDEPCWSYVKPAQRTRNGRMAYQNLHNHYLGANNVNNMATSAETKLKTVTYSGEKKRWDFERYVRTHVDQHSILEGLKGHGHAGIDDGSKVYHLIAGIKTSALDSVKTRIMSDAALRTDFEACVNLYKDFIKQSSALQNPVIGISAATTKKRKAASFEDDLQGVEVEDRYYSNKEYKKLSSEQKAKLKSMRDERGAKGKKSKKQKQDPTTSTMKKMTKQISALTAAIASSMGIKTDGQGDNSDPSTGTEDGGSGNRNNPALTRQRSGNDRD